MNLILQELLVPTLITAFGTALTAIFGTVAAASKKKLGVEIDQRFRDQLHAAIMTHVRMLLASRFNRVLTETDATALANRVPPLVKKSNPQTVAHFGVSDDMIANIAKAKVQELVGVAFSGIKDNK